MIKRVCFHLIFLAISFLLISCANGNENHCPSFEIVSPVSGKKYYSDTSIIFSTNLNSEDLIWKSDIDGELGKGYQLISKLTPGNHTVTLEHKIYGEKKTVSISVLEREEELKIEMICEFPAEIPGNRKKTDFAFLSLNGKLQGVKKLSSEISEDFFHVSNNESVLRTKPVFRETSVRSARGILPEEKEFYVIDTSDQSKAHRILASKIESGPGLSVYVEKALYEDGTYNENIKKSLGNLQSIILPRLKNFWGGIADLDQSGTLTIVFSQTLNEEGKAVGFFYPMDFFKRETDVASKNYNPYSNEMDVIYVGIPVTEEQDNYSVSSISATLAHEMTHAIAFSERVVFREVRGEESLGQLELFLDEGLAHLSESLCGFGDSGGNSRFVDYYLKRTKDYSFCEKDAYGFSDSIGQRGAMALFLYWLFDKAGGRKWNEEKSVWEDKGGISFLKEVISSDKSAWESIGESFGRVTDLLFIDFCKALYLNEVRWENKDPQTGEFVFAVSEPVIYTEINDFSVIPYSFSILDSGSTDSFLFEGSALSGQVYALYKN